MFSNGIPLVTTISKKNKIHLVSQHNSYNFSGVNNKMFLFILVMSFDK